MTKLTLETAAAQVQTVLSANTEIVDTVTTQKGVRNDKGHYVPQTTTFTVTGAGVSTPFNRHYLKTRKLARLALEKAGFTVTVTTPRKTGVTLVTVAPAKAAPKAAEAQTETAAA